MTFLISQAFDVHSDVCPSPPIALRELLSSVVKYVQDWIEDLRLFHLEWIEPFSSQKALQ